MSEELARGQTPPAQDCWEPKQAGSPGAAENPTVAGNVTGRAERYASFGALLSAFIASSWCWLPPLLILGGISGAGMMTIVEKYRPVFMVVTFGLLGGAFYVTYRPGATAASSRNRWMTFNKIMLWGVTVIAVVMLCFPQAIPGFSASSNRFTAEMQRTVIQIEGMT